MRIISELTSSHDNTLKILIIKRHNNMRQLANLQCYTCNYILTLIIIIIIIILIIKGCNFDVISVKKNFISLFNYV